MMKNSIKSKWEEIINHVKEEYNVSNLLFRTWLLPLTVYSEKNNTVLLIVNEEKQGSSTDIISNKYKMPLTIAIEEITGRQVDIHFILSKDIPKYESESDEISPVLIRKYPYLNSGHSFQSFVVSSSNSMAHAASLAVAENPTAQVYNPLFIYGDSGLGKTHLMHSIARYIIETSTKSNVMYVTSEVFTNEVIEAIRFNKTKGDSSATTALKEKYRNVDILLIDDIQFIIGKDSTQEEFFHTFNTLYESGKQIVISSDKPPKDMELLDERFRSRFEQGIIVDIQPPDYETSMAILRKICDMKKIKIDNSILDYIATNIKSNVRSLEGALNVIVLYTGLKHNNVDLEMAKELL
ncbi:MAG: chromosomal replication initiator protein DnaA, partial [Lachnoclostridium sp.]|nr:chromosomal replication initiator protein DnaA [Lachnoclostridium sp.]